jgi:hypothetical protein
MRKQDTAGMRTNTIRIYFQGAVSPDLSMEVRDKISSKLGPA